MAKPTIIIVGAEKGGVGKTTATRVLLHFFRSVGVANRAFDTEHPKGSLARFYPAEIVDLTDSDDQIKVFDTVSDQIVTVIDIRAGLLTAMLKTLSVIGFLDPAKFNIIVLHVLGNTKDSLNEVPEIAERLRGVRYITVANRTSETKYEFPPGVEIDIPHLNTKTAETVDVANAAYHDFLANPPVLVPTPSLVLRGYLGTWLDGIMAQIAAAKIP
ncbi:MULTISPECIES: hypothetical protein [unclassified Bradyrhizobium]|uniref:hypothetical protein n=1 Tax=unclassified Bradyrhizobium TaxID=2631580 RepID=UPI0028EFB820|nr:MULTISPECIES: hypothetical protein [unclassified Bradyrhizobium]